MHYNIMQHPRLHKVLRVAMSATAGIGVFIGTVELAQAQGSLASRELARRHAATSQAEGLLKEGREAYAQRDFKTAVARYKEALDVLPHGPRTDAQRKEINAHLADGSVALSQEYRRMGKYEEAKGLLGDVLKENPNAYETEKSLEYFDDPIRTNPSLTYSHTQNVDKVRRFLYQGEGFYNLGQYDEAMDKFQEVLRIDPYNKAARRWMEKCSAIKSDYYRAAYDETRARLLMEVDKAWEMTVPMESQEGQFQTGSGYQSEGSGAQLILDKLRNIIIPVVDFEDTTVEEAIDFLRQRSYELDRYSTNPDEKGVNFYIAATNSNTSGGGPVDLDSPAPSINGGDAGAVRIESLRLRNVPLQTALQYVCEAARLRYRVEEYAVSLLPLVGGGAEDLLTRNWRVPPTFLTDIQPGGGASSEEDGDIFDSDGGKLGGKGLVKRASVQEALRESGVDFPAGSSAQYIPASSTLIVKNTVTNLDLVDQIVENIFSQTPKQIKIMTKFVEVSQENTDELGFDWIVSPFEAGAQFFPGGGVLGSGLARAATDFLSPVANTAIPGVPATQGESTALVRQNTVTSGLRSGSGAISSNNIDAVLNNPGRTADAQSVAPGILSFTGLLDQGAFQMMIRGLSQKKGTDIMTAPSVLAKPGNQATIEIIREFIYPTEYEPPELPNEVGATGISNGNGSAGIFPVTPATPTAFETRNTGVTLEIEPNSGANDELINLRLAPEIVEFEGFINYGSPITSPATDAFNNATSVTITENRIEMPVFATRRVQTELSIYDGHTVAIGGLMREDIQNVEDKVPLLGDIPWIGRLFTSKSENHVKSNLIIFVTAQIIDPTGRPLKGSSLSVPDGGSSFSDVAPSIGGAGSGVLPLSDK